MTNIDKINIEFDLGYHTSTFVIYAHWLQLYSICGLIKLTIIIKDGDCSFIRSEVHTAIDGGQGESEVLIILKNCVVL